MLMRALSVHIAHEIAGAARIRHSLRPLNLERAGSDLQTSGDQRRELLIHACFALTLNPEVRR
jgi:hypothetical protein